MQTRIGVLWMICLKNLGMSNDLVKSETPPNWPALVERFPEASRRSESVVVTYAPYIYVPSGATLPPDLMAHEKTHLKQQGDNPTEWWERYFEDREFRMEQELEAYSVQLHMWRAAPAKIFKRAKDLLTADLAGPMYDLGLTRGEADAKLRRYEKLLA